MSPSMSLLKSLSLHHPRSHCFQTRLRYSIYCRLILPTLLVHAPSMLLLCFAKERNLEAYWYPRQSLTHRHGLHHYSRPCPYNGLLVIAMCVQVQRIQCAAFDSTCLLTTLALVFPYHHSSRH